MSDVYFIDRRADIDNSVIDRLKNLIMKMDMKDKLKENDTVAVKLHFGEPGLTTFLRPVYVKPFTREIKNCKAHPFLTDANTIYQGPRADGVRHLNTAIKNGFSYSVTGAPIVIADGMDSKNVEQVEVNGQYYNKVKIAGEAHRARGMVVLSHFKGHEMFGFGGAVKNIGMGLAVKEGKLSLHSSVKPEVEKSSCTKCAACIRHCPVDAIEMTEAGAAIDRDICTGCGHCIMVCPEEAVKIKWDMDFSEAQKRTAEYALGVVKPKHDRIWFFNFLEDITPECDCYGYSDAPLTGDIGIMASKDPVALDQASYDKVKEAEPLKNSKAGQLEKGDDKFKAGHPRTDPEAMFSYAQEIGLGEREYNLIELPR
ncbi:MAG: DUF362 domain-containing protein [Elusimicrobiota bacterium]